MDKLIKTVQHKTISHQVEQLTHSINQAEAINNQHQASSTDPRREKNPSQHRVNESQSP